VNPPNVISFTRARLHARAARHASVARSEARQRRTTQQPRVGCYELLAAFCHNALLDPANEHFA